MCGRYTLATPAELIGEHFDLPDPPALEPRYNIAPSQETLIIGSGDERRAAGLARWGLTVRHRSAPSSRLLINARIETVDRKPTFKEAVARRRCLVPADGFYEWRREHTIKQPIFFSLSGGHVFAFAGIWNRPDDDDEPVRFAILTTRPNTTVESTHSRMPVIVRPSDYEQWLEQRSLTREELERFATPYSADDMTSWPVSRLVNSPAHDVPACTAPIGTS